MLSHEPVSAVVWINTVNGDRFYFTIMSNPNNSVAVSEKTCCNIGYVLIISLVIAVYFVVTYKYASNVYFTITVNQHTSNRESITIKHCIHCHSFYFRIPVMKTT